MLTIALIVILYALFLALHYLPKRNKVVSSGHRDEINQRLRRIMKPDFEHATGQVRESH